MIQESEKLGGQTVQMIQIKHLPVAIYAEIDAENSMQMITTKGNRKETEAQPNQNLPFKIYGG